MHAQIASQLIPFRFENAFIDDSVFSSILLFECTWVSPYFCDTASSSDVGRQDKPAEEGSGDDRTREARLCLLPTREQTAALTG